MGDVIEIESSDEAPRQVSKTNNMSHQYKINESRRKIMDYQQNEEEKKPNQNKISRDIQEHKQDSNLFLAQFNQKYSHIEDNLESQNSPKTFKQVQLNNSRTTEANKFTQINEIYVRQFQPIFPVHKQSHIAHVFSRPRIVEQDTSEEEEQQYFKVDAKEGYLYRKSKVEDFIQQMLQNTFSIMKDEQDRKVLAEYMYEKKFRSFNEYLQLCSDDGRSLLTDPYKYFNIERQFVQKTIKEKQVMKEKQLLLQLQDELEPKALIYRQEKREKRQKTQQDKVNEQTQERRNKKRMLEIQFKENQKLIKRNQMRQAGIIYHKRQLRRQLNCIEIKEEDQPIQNSDKPIIVNQSILVTPFHTDQLRSYKSKVFQMIQDAYTDAKQNILKKLQDKRQEDQERRDKLRLEKQSKRQLKPQQIKIKDILTFTYSDQSGDSLMAIIEEEEDRQQKIIESKSKFMMSPVKEIIPHLVELDQPSDSDSFQSSIQDSLCPNQYQKDFVIVKGSGWLAIPNN